MDVSAALGVGGRYLLVVSASWGIWTSEGVGLTTESKEKTEEHGVAALPIPGAGSFRSNGPCYQGSGPGGEAGQSAR